VLRLLQPLIDLFPGSVHVRSLGLAGASDTAVWERARSDNLVLTTRDEDFVSMSVLRRYPPKVVWLNVGNARTAAIAALLRAHAEAIESFVAHDEYTFLAVGPGEVASSK
jgi:predicted nuclease of predicted toxin-antitoxin system